MTDWLIWMNSVPLMKTITDWLTDSLTNRNSRDASASKNKTKCSRKVREMILITSLSLSSLTLSLCSSTSEITEYQSLAQSSQCMVGQILMKLGVKSQDSHVDNFCVEQRYYPRLNLLNVSQVAQLLVWRWRSIWSKSVIEVLYLATSQPEERIQQVFRFHTSAHWRGRWVRKVTLPCFNFGSASLSSPPP